MESCLSPIELSRPTVFACDSTCTGSRAWFCVRTHPKHEHIAAAQLRLEREVEVFLPRVRYQRPTRCGPAWVTEALFKDYLFARFDLAASIRLVQSSRAVRGVVHFGRGWPVIPDAVIEELQIAMDGQELRVVDNTLHPGDTVEVASGSMRGLQALVTRVMPAKQRVAVLLDFLGRQTSVELDRNTVTFVDDEESHRARLPIWEESNAISAAER